MRSQSVLKELVETATGQRYIVRQERMPRQSFGRRFSVIFDDSVYELAAHLSAYATKVLLVLPKHLDWRAWKRLPQAEIAAHVGISQGSVSRALRELERHGVIESRGKGTAIEWRITRVIGYRGRVSQFHADEREARLNAARNDAGSASHPQQLAAPRLDPIRVIKGSCGKAPLEPMEGSSC